MCHSKSNWIGYPAQLLWIMFYKRLWCFNPFSAKHIVQLNCIYRSLSFVMVICCGKCFLRFIRGLLHLRFDFLQTRFRTQIIVSFITVLGREPLFAAAMQAKIGQRRGHSLGAFQGVFDPGHVNVTKNTFFPPAMRLRQADHSNSCGALRVLGEILETGADRGSVGHKLVTVPQNRKFQRYLICVPDVAVIWRTANVRPHRSDPPRFPEDRPLTHRLSAPFRFARMFFDHVGNKQCPAGIG